MLGQNLHQTMPTSLLILYNSLLAITCSSDTTQCELLTVLLNKLQINYDVLLTVHLSIILVINQLNAHILLL